MDNPSAPIPSISPQPAVSAPAQFPNRRWLLWLAGGLAILIFGIAIGIFGAKFLNQSQSQSQPTSAPTPTLSPTPTSAPNPTANWKTYINTEYNYSLKYPSNFTVGENGMSRGNAQKATAIVLYENKTVTFESPRFAVTVRSDPDSFENIVQKHYKKLTTNLLSEAEKQTASKNLGYPISDNQVVSPITKTSFNALSSSQYTIKGSTVDDGAGEYGVPQEEHKYIWFEANQKFFLISFTNTNTMDQILSTFKFLETISVSPIITSPTANSKVSSPLIIKGVVPAGWMFEGVFPIKLVDANKNFISQSQGKEVVSGSWSSGKAVEFIATLTFTTASKSGFVVLEKDNPSGLPENNASLEIPVSF